MRWTMAMLRPKFDVGRSSSGLIVDKRRRQLTGTVLGEFALDDIARRV
jgi:hypothetical protein